MPDLGELGRIEAAVAFLQRAGAADARAALVLGSGFASFPATLTDVEAIPFARIPHWPVPRVAGHSCELLLARATGLPVACVTGRAHLYEGHAPADVTRAVRSLALCGVRRFLLTNAAGGIRAGFRAGDLMRITDHLNLTGSSPLAGEHQPTLGPRFPDQTEVYSKTLAALLDRADPELHAGVYAGLLGPSYETPAEVRMLRVLGADAVGMSTVHEAIALNALGTELAAVSLISNLAAGIGGHPLSHGEVLARGEAAAERLGALVHGFCRLLQERGP